MAIIAILFGIYCYVHISMIGKGKDISKGKEYHNSNVFEQDVTNKQEVVENENVAYYAERNDCQKTALSSNGFYIEGIVVDERDCALQDIDIIVLDSFYNRRDIVTTGYNGTYVCKVDNRYLGSYNLLVAEKGYSGKLLNSVKPNEYLKIILHENRTTIVKLLDEETNLPMANIQLRILPKGEHLDLENNGYITCDHCTDSQGEFNIYRLFDNYDNYTFVSKDKSVLFYDSATNGYDSKIKAKASDTIFLYGRKAFATAMVLLLDSKSDSLISEGKISICGSQNRHIQSYEISGNGPTEIIVMPGLQYLYADAPGYLSAYKPIRISRDRNLSDDIRIEVQMAPCTRGLHLTIHDSEKNRLSKTRVFGLNKLNGRSLRAGRLMTNSEGIVFIPINDLELSQIDIVIMNDGCYYKYSFTIQETVLYENIILPQPIPLCVKVIDESTGDPIYGASIIIDMAPETHESIVGLQTNEKGYANINIGSKNNKIIRTYAVGYKDKKVGLAEDHSESISIYIEQIISPITNNNTVNKVKINIVDADKEVNSVKYALYIYEAINIDNEKLYKKIKTKSLSGSTAIEIALKEGKYIAAAINESHCLSISNEFTVLSDSNNCNDTTIIMLDSASVMIAFDDLGHIKGDVYLRNIDLSDNYIKLTSFEMLQDNKVLINALPLGEYQIFIENEGSIQNIGTLGMISPGVYSCNVYEEKPYHICMQYDYPESYLGDQVIIKYSCKDGFPVAFKECSKLRSMKKGEIITWSVGHEAIGIKDLSITRNLQNDINLIVPRIGDYIFEVIILDKNGNEIGNFIKTVTIAGNCAVEWPGVFD